MLVWTNLICQIKQKAGDIARGYVIEIDQGSMTKLYRIEDGTGKSRVHIGYVSNSTGY
jgi:hypothetical protein